MGVVFIKQKSDGIKVCTKKRTASEFFKAKKRPVEGRKLCFETGVFLC